MNPIGYRSCYDEGKRSAECLFFDYKRKYELSIKQVRIFNTYGPGMLPYDGRGTQTRSFCYVDDLIAGLIRVMNLESEFSGPLNLGRAEEVSMLNLALLIKEMTESNSTIVFEDLAFSIEPIFSIKGCINLSPVINVHFSNNYNKDINRQVLNVPKDKKLALLAHNGFEGELDNLLKDIKIDPEEYCFHFIF